MKPYFNLHTHKSSGDLNVLDLVSQYPNDFDDTIAFYSIGIHPWYIVEDAVENNLLTIESKLKIQNCLAIGECGLDKRIEYPFDKQLKVLEKQLLLAKKHNKPIILHCVGAFQEIIAIKKRLKITQPMIIHGFSKNIEMANQLLSNGFYLSFGKHLLQQEAFKFVFEQIPNNRIFLETDSTSLNIKAVYQTAADFKNMTISDLQEIIKENYKTVFEIV